MTVDRIDGPRPVEVPPEDHLLRSLWDARSDERVLLSRPDGTGGWDDLTATDVARTVRRLAAGLVARGIAPGDRVAILSPTRCEWVLADLAIMAAGGVTVPLYETSSRDQVESIVAHSKPVMAFVADDDAAALVADTVGGDSGRDRLIVFDGGGLEALERSSSDEREREVDRRIEAMRGSDLATIVYTSGTTGEPKGCRLTHRNLVWTARQVLAHLDDALEDDDSTLLFLPLAHVFTRVVQFVALERRIRVGFARSLDDLAEDLRSFRPTFLLAVPRVFEKLLNSAEEQATGLKAPVFRFAKSAGVAWSRAASPSSPLRAARAIGDRLVYAKLRRGVGGQVRFCVSGGAPLSEEIAHFFRAAGIPILEGYGLTETSAPATVNRPSSMRIGTVGSPIPGVSVKTDDQGELLVRGENVFEGYHEAPDATAETMDGEWFRTGDLGSIDEDGFVTVSGRKKDVIVTAGGKNVEPGPLEDQLRQHPLIANAMVIGDDRPFVAALITVEPDELSKRDVSVDDPGLAEEVRHVVDEANRQVSRAESIREFVVLDRDFSEDDGELTHTMKLRRQVIVENFADEIEAIYADGP